MHFNISPLCANLPILTDLTLELLGRLYLGTIHKLDQQGFPARPYCPILFVAVRKETQRLVEAGQGRCDDWRTLTKLPPPPELCGVGFLDNARSFKWLPP